MLTVLYFKHIQNIYFYSNTFIYNKTITVAIPSNENTNILPTSNKMFFEDLCSINNIFF